MGIEYVGDVWCVYGGVNIVEVKIVVNVVGVWVDIVVVLVGVVLIGIELMCCMIVQVCVDSDVLEDLFFVIDVVGIYYFCLEGLNWLWLCSYDEMLVEFYDVVFEEFDVVIVIDWFEIVIDWKVVVVECKWVGLCSFVLDCLLVYGFVFDVAGFFWCVGQGGFGIQMVFVVVRMCVYLILGDVVLLFDGVGL